MEICSVLLHELGQYMNQCTHFPFVLLQCEEYSKVMHNAGGQIYEIEKTQESEAKENIFQNIIKDHYIIITKDPS
jgi:hypothetical protein